MTCESHVTPLQKADLRACLSLLIYIPITGLPHTHCAPNRTCRLGLLVTTKHTTLPCSIATHRSLRTRCASSL